MEVINILKDFLGLNNMPLENFGDFISWFATLALTVFIIAVIIKCFFITANKINRGYK